MFLAPNNRTLKTMNAARAATDADGRFKFDAPDMTYRELDGLPARSRACWLQQPQGTHRTGS